MPGLGRFFSPVQLNNCSAEPNDLHKNVYLLNSLGCVAAWIFNINIWHEKLNKTLKQTLIIHNYHQHLLEPHSHGITRSNQVKLTLSPHANFKALLEAAVLALIAVVLVHGTVPVPSAAVGQVASNRALKKALAALTCELTVVFTARFVPTHHAVDVG